MAERRDLIVATYSSLCGTGDAATVTVFTGIGCPCPAAAGSVAGLPQPAMVTVAMNRTSNLRIRPIKHASLPSFLLRLHRVIGSTTNRCSSETYDRGPTFKACDEVPKPEKTVRYCGRSRSGRNLTRKYAKNQSETLPPVPATLRPNIYLLAAQRHKTSLSVFTLKPCTVVTLKGSL